jgi:RimJ/RimL family protein N-acetyltransferase
VWQHLAMSGLQELRLVSESDIALLEALTQDAQTTGEFQWFGWNDLPRWRRGWLENGLIDTDGGTLLAVDDDDRLGLVNWRRRPTTPAASCWTIGVIIAPGFRGQGHGTVAHRLLARYLFAHTTAHRIEAATETGNIAEQRALEKAGFTREGVLRGIGWRDGAWRDGVTYSLLRTDPANRGLTSV